MAHSSVRLDGSDEEASENMTSTIDLGSISALRGVYTADRASQLSGVPLSTVYYWARASKLVIPSISAEKIKLWSFRDLLFLRLVAWLRKQGVNPRDVRRALGRFREFPAAEIRAGGKHVFVSLEGDEFIDLDNQGVLKQLARMLPEFTLDASAIRELGSRKLWGPDLLRPSGQTRIHPDVLGGEPFVNRTRIPTAAIYALARRGLRDDRIAELYEVNPAVVRDVRWLEDSLQARRRLEVAA